MSDYISRDEIFSVWRSMPRPASISSLTDAINRTPAADVEPVRHGQWGRTDDDWNSLTTFQCTVCGEEFCFEIDEDLQLLNYNYCPNCGAKMDLEDE
nr:MAG TPA: zinc-ribbon domain protein [Caudoviricetes sp.]